MGGLPCGNETSNLFRAGAWRKRSNKHPRGGDPPPVGEAAQSSRTCASLRRRGVLLQGWNGVGVQCQVLILFLSNRLRAREQKRTPRDAQSPGLQLDSYLYSCPRERQLSPFTPLWGATAPPPAPQPAGKPHCSGYSRHPSLNSPLWLLIASGTCLGLLAWVCPLVSISPVSFCSLSPCSSPPCPLTRV